VVQTVAILLSCCSWDTLNLRTFTTFQLNSTFDCVLWRWCFASACCLLVIAFLKKNHWWERTSELCDMFNVYICMTLISHSRYCIFNIYRWGNWEPLGSWIV